MDKINCPFEKLYPSELQRDDLYYMKQAYNKAIDAWSEDETPIGAVILYQGQLIASSHNMVESTKDPTAHAEILAITQASRFIGDWRLNDATLYVTKEPCPMCSGAILMSRISRVYYAVSDNKMGCLGGATNLNDIKQFNHHCEITSGILEEECKLLIQKFFKGKRNN